MQAIGERLREARMRQKIDIAEVEAATKIRAKYLRAIENEEFDLLPGTTFARTFLRTYAEYLGLDAHVLVDEYRERYEPREPEVPLAPQRRRIRDRDYGARPGRGFAIVAAVLAAVVFLAILGLTGGEEDPDPGGRASEQAEDREERAERRRQRRERGQRPDRRRTGVSLRVEPVGETYVCVEDGRGDVVFEGTLDAPRTFRGRTLRINLGRRSAALRVNGRQVRFEEGAEPIGFEFTGRRQEELPPAQRPCA